MRLSLRHTGLAPLDPNRGIASSLTTAAKSDGCMRIAYTPPELRWFWSITVIGAHQAGIRTNGRAATLEEAKAQFETNYREWLVWAELEVES